MARVRAGDGVDRLTALRGLHRVGATAAMHMQVDEAGQRDRLGAVAPGFVARRLALQRDDAPAVVRQRAAQPTTRREDQAFDRGHSNGRSLASAK